MKESDLYPDVKNWLYGYLKSRYRTAKIITEDTHNIKLSAFIFRKGLINKFPRYKVFDIKTDITGVIIRKSGASSLVFVEFKITKITLTNVGQLLGYSLVADPLYRYNRYNILQYNKDKKIQIVPWGINRKGPVWKDKIPS